MTTDLPPSLYTKAPVAIIEEAPEIKVPFKTPTDQMLIPRGNPSSPLLKRDALKTRSRLVSTFCKAVRIEASEPGAFVHVSLTPKVLTTQRVANGINQPTVPDPLSLRVYGQLDACRQNSADPDRISLTLNPPEYSPTFQNPYFRQVGLTALYTQNIVAYPNGSPMSTEQLQRLYNQSKLSEELASKVNELAQQATGPEITYAVTGN